jgi:hypothetical protein
MLIPYLVWAGLWLFAFPGIKNGFDREVAIALFATSGPLVAWFFLSALGFIANSMAGVSEFDRPAAGLAWRIIALLPGLAIAIAAASALYLGIDGHPWYSILAPVAAGAVIAAAIVAGERARRHEHAQAPGRPETGMATPGSVTTVDESTLPTGRLVLWAILAAAALLLITLVWGIETALIGIGLAGTATIFAAFIFVGLRA